MIHDTASLDVPELALELGLPSGKVGTGHFPEESIRTQVRRHRSQAGDHSLKRLSTDDEAAGLNGDEVQYAIMAFRCRVVGGELRPDGEEVSSVQYLNAAQLATLPMPTWLQRIYPSIFAAARIPALEASS
jgi:hypothetical protein